MRSIVSKILSFLRARTKIGGLEISDTDLRFAYFNGDSLVTSALRIPPGIIEGGDIKNQDLLVEALKKLHDIIPNEFGKRKPINAVVTLSSIRIYTQVFNLPMVEGENLKEAIQLNIRMISPFDLAGAYAGWQFVNQDKNALKIEVLSAFAQRTFIDQLRAAFIEAGFFPVAVESGTLSLTRLIRERGVDFEAEKPLLVLSVDDRGFHFLIVRLGQLHFEYFQSWRDIQGEKREVSWQDFEDAIKRNFHQVFNFYGSHWQEPLTDAFIASNSLVEEISKVVRENFSLNVKELKLRFDQTLRREWYEVAGSAIRGEVPRVEDEDINLFGTTVQEEFRRNQIIDFLKFWEAMVPSVLGLLVVFFAAGYFFLYGTGEAIKAQSSFTISDRQLEEINALQTEIEDFNKSVKLLSDFEKTLKPKTPIITEISYLANKHEIAINRLNFQPSGLAASLSGETSSQDRILNFKNAMSASNYFSSVNLNLADIKPQTGGFSFTINFGVNFK